MIPNVSHSHISALQIDASRFTFTPQEKEEGEKEDYQLKVMLHPEEVITGYQSPGESPRQSGTLVELFKYLNYKPQPDGQMHQGSIV